MVHAVETPLILSGSDQKPQNTGTRVFIESKKLWSVAGPSILGNILSYSTMAITQAFAGHLGDFELASISIANSVIIAFSSGLMVCVPKSLYSLTK